MSADGAASFEVLACIGFASPGASVTLEGWSASGSAAGPAGGVGAVTLELVVATGTSPFVTAAGSGSVSFETATAFGTSPPKASVELEVLTASGSARALVRGEATFLPMEGRNAAALLTLEVLSASGSGSEVVASTFHVLAMNTRHKGVTEFSSYQFNSFARVRAGYLAAGAQGLVLLGADDDNGTNIAWSARTGQMDEGKVNLKRLPEVVLGLRSNGDVLVRVHSDDNTYNDYNMQAVKRDTIYQHRVKPGKGLRSRWFSVELQGVEGSDIELASLQANMVPVDRRLG
jgi:hypothetical protein